MAHHRRKITLARLAAHDFRRALRILRRNHGSTDIMERLITERSKTLAAAVKTLGFSIVLAFWLHTNKGSLNLQLHLVDVSIPSIYVNFVFAFCLFSGLIALLNYFVLSEFIRIASNELFKFDSAWSLTTIFDGGSAWSSAIVPQFRFFKSRTAHNFVSLSSLVTITIPFIAVIVFCYVISIRVGYSAIDEAGLVSGNALLTVVAWGLELYPILFLLVNWLPFAFDKNVEFIRWNFLYRIHRRAGVYPPRVSAWIRN